MAHDGRTDGSMDGRMDGFSFSKQGYYLSNTLFAAGFLHFRENDDDASEKHLYVLYTKDAAAKYNSLIHCRGVFPLTHSLTHLVDAEHS